jgi:hypothetical protein
MMLQYDGVEVDTGASVPVESHPTKDAYSAGRTLHKSNAWHSAVVGSPPHCSTHPTISAGNNPHTSSIVGWASTGMAVAAKKLVRENIMIGLRILTVNLMLRYIVIRPVRWNTDYKKMMILWNYENCL